MEWWCECRVKSGRSKQRPYQFKICVKTKDNVKHNGNFKDKCAQAKLPPCGGRAYATGSVELVRRVYRQVGGGTLAGVGWAWILGWRWEHTGVAREGVER